MNYLRETLEYLSKLFQWWVIVQPWEQGIRVRAGKKSLVMKGGTYFRIPFVDTVYIQEIRTRIVEMSPQTVSTKDRRVLTILVSVAYSIADIEKLFNTIARPEITIGTLAMSEVAQYVITHNINECNPIQIMEHVDKALSTVDYGLKFEGVRITGYAETRTYRIIQDGHYIREQISIEQKR